MIPLSRFGDVLLGAACQAREKSADTLTETRTRWNQESIRAAAEIWGRWTLLAERGAAERERGRRGAQRAVDAAVDRMAHSTLVDRVVNAQLDRVLTLLENEPDRVRAIVRGQSDSIVGEAIGRVRSGAAAGDDVVDRFTVRMTGRGKNP